MQGLLACARAAARPLLAGCRFITLGLQHILCLHDSAVAARSAQLTCRQRCCCLCVVYLPLRRATPLPCSYREVVETVLRFKDSKEKLVRR